MPANNHEKFHYEARYTLVKEDNFINDTETYAKEFDTEQDAHVWALGKVLDPKWESRLRGLIRIIEVETRVEELYRIDKESALKKLAPKRETESDG